MEIKYQEEMKSERNWRHRPRAVGINFFKLGHREGTRQARGGSRSDCGELVGNCISPSAADLPAPAAADVVGGTQQLRLESVQPPLQNAEATIGMGTLFVSAPVLWRSNLIAAGRL